MNYEIKAVRPGSVFVNSLRIFLIVGFIAAIYSFFFSPYSGIRLISGWQKIFLPLLFTGVYALVVSIILWFIGRIYNAFILDFDPRSLFMYNVFTYLIPGLVIWLVKFLTGLSGGTAMLFRSFASGLLICITFTAAGSISTTALILLWHTFLDCPSQRHFLHRIKTPLPIPNQTPSHGGAAPPWPSAPTWPKAAPVAPDQGGAAPFKLIPPLHDSVALASRPY